MAGTPVYKRGAATAVRDGLAAKQQFLTDQRRLLRGRRPYIWEFWPSGRCVGSTQVLVRLGPLKQRGCCEVAAEGNWLRRLGAPSGPNGAPPRVNLSQLSRENDEALVAASQPI